MKWLSIGVVAVVMLAGCQAHLMEKDLGLRIPSPSGRYILTASESARAGEQPRISLGLRNSEGDVLDVIHTDIPASMKWAVGWAPGEDVVVLTSEQGTPVYNIEKNDYIVWKNEKLSLMECPPPRYGNVALDLRRMKYGSPEAARP